MELEDMLLINLRWFNLCLPVAFEDIFLAPSNNNKRINSYTFFTTCCSCKGGEEQIPALLFSTSFIKMSYSSPSQREYSIIPRPGQCRRGIDCYVVATLRQNNTWRRLVCLLIDNEE